MLRRIPQPGKDAKAIARNLDNHVSAPVRMPSPRHIETDLSEDLVDLQRVADISGNGTAPLEVVSAGRGLLALETENAALKAELEQLKRQMALSGEAKISASGTSNSDPKNGFDPAQSLNALADTLPIPVYLIDVDNDESLLDNGRLDTLLGYAPGALDRLRRAALVHPEDRGIRQQILELLSDPAFDGVHHSVMRLRHRLGEWRRFHFYDRVLERHPDGRPKQLIGCAECREASALQAESRAEVLEQERAILRQTLAALPHASVVQFDTDGIIQLVEGSDLQAIGGSAEALLGRAVGSPGLPGHAGRIPEDRYRQCLRGDRQQLELHAGEKVYALSLIPLFADETTPGTLTAPLRAGAAQTRRVIGGLQVLQDISQHVAPQEQLEQQLMELAETNEALRACMRDGLEMERTLQSVAHDLKQPIRSVHSFAQLLERRLVMDLKSQTPEGEAPVLHADLQDCLAYIRQGSRRMEAMVEGLMAYGQAQDASGTEASDAEVLDLGECLEGVLQGLAQQIGEKQVQIIYTDLPEITGNAVDIGKLLQNLVSNAIKFNDKAYPEVVVDAYDEEGRWHLTVADNGIGIPEEARDKVFGLFQRLHSKEDYEGAGIGLSLCQRIVERHGGSIWLESQPGEGTTFHVKLPKN